MAASLYVSMMLGCFSALMNPWTEGESTFQGWTAVLHLVDIFCCCAVLIPIVWQVNQLEKSCSTEDGDGENAEGGADKADEEDTMEDRLEKGRILEKLKLFRSFYMLVVAYIYSTRIVVYLFATMLSYEHLWFQHLLVEMVTLSFYVVTGYQFRPMADNAVCHRPLFMFFLSFVYGNFDSTPLLISRTVFGNKKGRRRRR